MDEERDPFVEGFGIPTFEPAATPKERLRQVFNRNDMGVRSFELDMARKTAYCSFAFGMLIGGARMKEAAEKTWKRTHYHSLFMSNKDAGSYFMNYMLKRFLIDGGRFGLRVGFVTGVLSLTAGCLAARRDKARVTDAGIAGALASFLYRLDVGPRAMLASGVIGCAFWQFCALLALPVLRLSGYTWDGFYKELRRMYYEEMNGRAMFVKERMEIGSKESLWPWQVSRRWAEYKLQQEERLAELRKLNRESMFPVSTASQNAPMVAAQEKK